MKVRIGVALQLGDNALREGLAEFHAPLVEGIDPPDGSLGEDAVLVERDQLTQRGRRQAIEQRARKPSD